MRWSFNAETMGAHVHVTVRCGPQPGQRPLLGNLVMRTEEWDEFRAVFLHDDSCWETTDDDEPLFVGKGVPGGAGRHVLRDGAVTEYEPYSAEEIDRLREAVADEQYQHFVGRLVATVDRVTEAYQDAVTERGMVEGQWRKVMPFQWEYIALVVECVANAQPVPTPEVDGNRVALWGATDRVGGTPWRVGWIDASGYVLGGVNYATPAAMAEAIRRWRPTP